MITAESYFLLPDMVASPAEQELHRSGMPDITARQQPLHN